MTFHIVAITGLVAVFVIGSLIPVNIGALALAAAFLIGPLVLHAPIDDIFGGFPVSLFMLLFGVTYLFGIASSNGTMDWLLGRITGRLEHRRLAIPPLFFVAATVLSSVGVVAPAVAALLSRVSADLARRMRINPVLLALMVVIGATAGNFSPIGVLALIANSTLTRNHLPTNPLALFAITFAYNLVLGVIAFFIYGGHRLRASPDDPGGMPDGGTGGSRTPHTVPTSSGGPAVLAAEPARVATAEPTPPDSPRVALTPPRIATLVAIVVLVVGLLAFKMDVGALSIGLAVVLQLLYPRANKAGLDKVSWQVVVLICGVVTYVALMQRGGTIKALGSLASGMSIPLLACLVIVAICTVAAVSSAAGLITATMALAVPFLASGKVSTLALVAAICITTTVVDASPFTSLGALMVANAPEDDRRPVFRGLVRWAIAMVITAPLVTVAVLVAPNWL